MNTDLSGEQQIFISCLERPKPERRQYLRTACGDRPELLERILQLLEAHDDLEKRTRLEDLPDRKEAPILPSSDGYGPYHILEKLGEGGIGVVYLAEQIEPVRRRVALKLIKTERASRSLLARFENERQALAFMDHPFIARFFDAGTADSGQPYFVMEYVRGLPVDQYCDRNRLGIRQRLELFVQICAAVQHAHQKAIIHRDLKPSNILVSTLDDRPLPKVIDFGIAKAVTTRLTERTLHTEMGQVLGTPQYMSPEQAEMGPDDIDTRTDVYSLGVVLYQLLAGSLPLAPESLQNCSFGELLRKLREEDPPKPSTRVRRDAETMRATRAATNRNTDPFQLLGQLKGDLDRIVMKAIARDRRLRYGSPAELAADIRRFLRDEPITATPPSLLYRSRKFVKRYRVGVAVLATTFLLLVATSIVMTFQAQKIARERDRASQEARSAREVSEFLTGLFRQANPHVTQTQEITARQLLDEGARRIATELGNQPLILARLQETIAEAYENLGLYGEAEDHYTASYELFAAELGEEHRQTLVALGNLGNIYWRQGRYEAAEEIFLRSRDLRRKTLGLDHPMTRNAAGNLANLYLVLGRYQEAETLYLELLETWRTEVDAQASGALDTANNLSSLYLRQNRVTEARKLLEKLVNDRRALQGRDHPHTLGAMNNLAECYSKEGNFGDAERLYRAVLESRIRVLGREHPDTLTSMNNLATLQLQRSENLPEAEELLRAALQGRRETLGDQHPETITTQFNLAQLYGGTKRYSQAEELFQRVVEEWSASLSSGHPYTQRARSTLAQLYYSQRRFQEAEKVYLDQLEIWKRGEGDPSDLMRCYHNLACVNAQRGEGARALEFLKESLRYGGDPRLLDDPDLDPVRETPAFQNLHGRPTQAETKRNGGSSSS